MNTRTEERGTRGEKKVVYYKKERKELIDEGKLNKF